MATKELSSLALYVPTVFFWNACIYVKGCIWPIRRHPIWLFLFVLLFVSASLFLPVGTFIQKTVVWINSLDRAVGVPVTLVLQVIFNVLCLPSALLVVFSGFSWGFTSGVLISWIGCSISMVLCYIIGRSCIKWKMRKWLTGSAYLCLLMNKIDSLENVGWIIFFFRLSPMMPISISSYILAIIDCPFFVYLIPSVVGIFPPVVLCVYLGQTVGTLYELIGSSEKESQVQASIRTNKIIAMCVGLILVVLSTGIIAYLISKFLKQIVLPRGLEQLKDTSPDQLILIGKAESAKNQDQQMLVCIELDDVLIGSCETEDRHSGPILSQ